MVDTDKMVGIILGLTISLILIGVLLPTGLSTFYNGNFSTITGIDSSTATMITTLIPIMIVIGIVLAIVGAVKLRKSI